MMAYRPTRNGRVSTGIAPDHFTYDHASRHEQPRRARHQPGSPFETFTSSMIQVKEEGGGADGDSGQTSSADNQGKADVSDANVSEADEENDDDDDGDAHAPSDRAIEGYGDQAGLINEHGESKSERYNKASVGSLESDVLDSKQSGSPQRKTVSQNQECDSDDEVYNGVDLISDSDGGDTNVEETEERAIIQSRKGATITGMLATVPASATETSDEWAGFELEEGFFATDISQFEEQYGGNEQSILGSEIELFRSVGMFEDITPILSPPASSKPRRVRFKEPIPPSCDDSDVVSDDEDLNDLFNSAAATPCKDLLFDAQDVNEDGDDCSVGSSSGYETDYGDTTDEEDVPASATARPERLLRQPSFSSSKNHGQMPSSAAPGTFKVPTTPAPCRRGPRMGSWVVDRTKPFAMIDCTGDNMVIVPARRSASATSTPKRWDNSVANTADTSPVNSQRTCVVDDSGLDFTDFSAFDPSPMLASEPDVMPSTLLPTAPSSQVQDQTFASSVFVPMEDMNNLNNIYTVDDQSVDDEDDDEVLLRVEDFIDFGVSSDDEADDEPEVAENAALPTPTSTSPSGVDTRMQSKPEVSSTHDLLKHLDKGLVGSFRRGQTHHQANLRRPHGGVSLNSHAFKGGRHAAGHSSLSAQKKRKLSDAFGSRPAFGKRRLSNRR